MVSKLIENGVDVCEPVGCYSNNKPEIVVESYTDVIAISDTVRVKWSILNVPSGAEIIGNQLIRNADPFDLKTVISASGSDPYIASFTAPAESGVTYFKIQVTINHTIFFTPLFTIVVSGTSSSSSSRIAVPAVSDRI